jgi:hypothetical protein
LTPGAAWAIVPIMRFVDARRQQQTAWAWPARR